MKSSLYLIIFLLCFHTYADSLKEQIESRKSQSKSKTPAEIKKIMQKATEELKASGIEEKALGVGRKVPDFKIGEKPIKSFYEKGVTVVTFYRGGWCPYCMLQLKEFERLYSDFKKDGITLIALAPDTAKEIKKTKRNHKLSFPIFSDSNNEIASQFGLAFQLPADLQKVYQKFGIDLKASQGNSENRLPMPGTYIIDKEGNIRYAFAKADYTLRAEPRDVLKRAQSIQR
ncbi:MAG: alkyl hydroperoxide reductase [Halobacteriovoraceae bacterium]|nr:alkyl hydroperoxide reductase [Halobacteriovoraceae bacterium]